MANKNSLFRSLPYLLIGAGLTTLVGWEPNVLLATWLVPLFLLRFGRMNRVWTIPGLMLPALALIGLVNIRGAWHMGLPVEIAFSFVMSLPLVFSVLADRLLRPRLSPLLGTLVFPATWVLFDYGYSHIYGLGDIFSPALTQFHFAPLLQLSSLTGIYGITFLIGWFASVAALIWEAPGDPGHYRRPLVAFAVTFALVLLHGSARLTFFDHETATVRVASIVLPHERDYWEEIIDIGTPRAEADAFKPELKTLEDRWFEESERAVSAGAKIVFWSEAGAVMYEDDHAAFQTRAEAFAKEQGVWFQTSSLVMRYGDPMIDNQVTLYTPEGERAYRYLKTQSWYPTESDGIIPSVETPYGRLSTVICFDLDVPHWMRQVARQEVDILLVPGFDTLPISPYHTEVGLFRAVEYGVNIVRGVSAGTSMAVDTVGRTLALQDSFRTTEPIMYTDVPARGEQTLYGLLGDWLPWAALLGLLGLLGLAFRGAGRNP